MTQEHVEEYVEGPRPRRGPAPWRWLRHERTRALLYQVAALAAVVALGWFLVATTLDNLAARHIATGFGYLDEQAAFAIGEAPIAYEPRDSYARALLVGLLNTLRVAVSGIVLATLLGVVIGIARLSSNWLVAKLAAVYVEALRNVPLLLQLFLWYGLLIHLPPPRLALEPLPHVFLSNRGVVLPWITWQGGTPGLSLPELGGFRFTGGLALSPEFAALLFGLTLYTAAFIAEIVRGGILAVPRGQWEAAAALGLGRGLALRLIVLPQALRVILPPTTSQYLNLTKNSSLAVAIGYPDLVSVANTTLNQTGQAIENIALIMAVYLTISLGISALMNWYDRRIALVER
jgi:general L-amino acid transport system permease protein